MAIIRKTEVDGTNRDLADLDRAQCQLYCPPPSIKVGCSCKQPDEVEFMPSLRDEIGDIIAPETIADKTNLMGDDKRAEQAKKELAPEVTNIVNSTLSGTLTGAKATAPAPRTATAPSLVDEIKDLVRLLINRVS